MRLFLSKVVNIEQLASPRRDTMVMAMYKVTVLRDNKPIVGPKRFLEKSAAEKARIGCNLAFHTPAKYG